jgi:hypothetical protein
VRAYVAATAAAAVLATGVVHVGGLPVESVLGSAPALASSGRPSNAAMRVEAVRATRAAIARDSRLTAQGAPFLTPYSDARLFHNWQLHGKCAQTGTDVRSGGERGWAFYEVCWNVVTGDERVTHVGGLPR